MNKRKSNGLDTGPPPKLQKTIYPAYFIPELAHVVAMCDEKLPFVCMAQELSRRLIPHSGLQVEANATSLVLKLLSLPQPGAVSAQMQAEGKISTSPVVDPDVWNALMKRLLSVAIRSQFNINKHNRVWTIELVFFGTPLQSGHHREQGQRRTVYYQFEMGPSDTVGRTIDSLLNDWSKIVYLYSIVHDFAEQYKNGEFKIKNEKYNLQNLVTIKSYSYTSLLLGFGPNKEVSVNIFWCTEAKEFKMVSFCFVKLSAQSHFIGFLFYPQIFIGGNSAINAHSMMREQLQSHLNRHISLAQIVILLHETYQPLSSIAKISIIPQLGVPVSSCT